MNKLFSIFLVFAIFSGAIIVHELIHQEINYQYGIKSEIRISERGIATFPDKNAFLELSEQKQNSLLQAQANTETIGYTTIYFGTILLAIFVFERERKLDL